MPIIAKPILKPVSPEFSSGPCKKWPGWTPAALDSALVGRSHRSADGRARLKLAIDRTRDLLQLPDGYILAITPASDTGAFELAMWSMLGARGVDVLAWESFGRLWLTDAVDHLRLDRVRTHVADYGALPDLADVDFDNDVLFAWNGTTSGVRIPNSDWIAADRRGLTFVDATSAVFAQRIDWTKTDVVTFSWQKALGGEAAHGMLVLSPRAIARLDSYVPPRPLPKLFRLTAAEGRLNRAIFDGETINTPSMLCVEDVLGALDWAARIGGIEATIARADSNARALHDWISATPFIANLAIDPDTWSNTSVCMTFADPAVARRPSAVRRSFARRVADLLAAERAAYDVMSYRDAPPGLRIWTGPTIERNDVEALTPWIEWAYREALTGVA